MPRKVKAEEKGRESERGKGRDSVSPFSRRGPTVAVVGAGRLGTALARALAEEGYVIEALVARTLKSARRAAEASAPSAKVLSAGQLSELPPAELLLITTPDDRVTETAARLAALPGLSAARGRVALHTSGALSSDVLAPLGARGYAVGSMHPLAAVSGGAAGAESLRRAFYCVEGDARAVRLARRVVGHLGGRSFSVAAEDKALYHAAAVLAAGHVVALFDAAARLLASCGLAEARAREVLLPLLASTHANLACQTPARALTGTFARADLETVRKHLAALRGSEVTGALPAYLLLGELSLRLAAEGGADPAALEEIRRALDDARRA